LVQVWWKGKDAAEHDVPLDDLELGSLATEAEKPWKGEVRKLCYFGAHSVSVRLDDVKPLTSSCCGADAPPGYAFCQHASMLPHLPWRNTHALTLPIMAWAGFRQAGQCLADETTIGCSSLYQMVVH
jgi:hypothetical protein